MKPGDATRALGQLEALYAGRWPWILSLKHDTEWDPCVRIRASSA
jgi:hypothetical protein